MFCLYGKMIIKQQNLVKCFFPSLYGRLIQKTRTGASFIPGWLFYFVSRLHDDGLFHILVICLKVHFMSIKYTCDSKLQTLLMRYRPIQFTCKPILHRNRWSFRVYMILVRNFEPEWIFGVNLRRGDSRRHDILWWYHVNKYRAMRGNWSDLAPARKSSLVSCKHPLTCRPLGQFPVSTIEVKKKGRCKECMTFDNLGSEYKSSLY